MRRLRLGLNGFANPALRPLYGGRPAAEWLTAYAERFGCYEVAGTADPAWSDAASLRLADIAPPTLTLLPQAPERADPDWGHRVRSLLRRPGTGPVYLPWTGAWTPSRHAALEDRLNDLWDHLPAGGRVAVEFHDPSWLQSDLMHLLEMHEAALVWSTRTGAVPFRRTSDFLYLRLTGHSTRRTGDEVAALLARLRQQVVDDRETFVVSARAEQPYGLHALERFARGMGVPWTPVAPAAQASLASFQVPA